MSEPLEQELREALADRAALITSEASARLRAIDYNPHRRSLRAPALGVLGLTGAAATAGAVILLGSSAAPAFAGWTASPTAPAPGQLAAAAAQCRAEAGTPVLTDPRGPYTASIYADGSTCVAGDGITISSRRSGVGMSTVPAGTVELTEAGQSDSDGHALTMVDGQIGAGVTGVTIARSDGSSVQATVKNGWYLAWWPGTARAATARVATASATSTQSFPTGPDHPGPVCPPGARCASGYGFASGPAGGAGRSSTVISGGSSAGSRALSAASGP
jgi:hypothetical protein